MLTGTITALVTPMMVSGEIDFVSLNKLLAFQINNKVTGLVVCGSTGESATLSNSEKVHLIKHVIQEVAKLSNSKIHIIVGISYASTQEAIECVQKFNYIDGIDAYMVLTPYYVRPPQSGIYAHFAAIAKVAVYPVIAYNVPARTGCCIAVDTMAKLANDFKIIQGLKDATGDLNRCFALASQLPQGFRLYCGEDLITVPFMLCGGSGTISVLSNIIPQLIVSLCDYALKFDIDKSRTLHNKLLELQAAITLESNPIPVKWALFHMGIIATPAVRLPLTEFSGVNQERLKPILERIINEKNCFYN